MCIVHPTYFPNIAHFVTIAKNNDLVFEVCDNYTKQTYRNRTCIYGANGKLQLNIPVNHSQKERQLYKDVKVVNDSRWQLQHLKSLESAYRTSPFYEFYEDEIRPLFEKEVQFLMDFNFNCLEVLLDCLQLDVTFSKSEYYSKDINTSNDYRPLVQCKKEIVQQFSPYTQVFDTKHDFLPNLSVLDLLFNEGPNSLNYLEQQEVNLV